MMKPALSIHSRLSRLSSASLIRPVRCGILLAMGLLLSGANVEAAPITHLNVDFDTFSHGNVSSQQGWRAEDQALPNTGNISATIAKSVSTARDINALSIYRPTSAPASYAGVNLSETYNLNTNMGLSYLAVDFYRPESTSSAVATLTASSALPASLTFGFAIFTGTAALQLNTGGTRYATEQAIQTDTWYRLELVATPGTSSRSGTYSAYLSWIADDGGQSDGRIMIAENVAYNFVGANSSNMFAVIPQGAGSGASVEFANLYFASGLSEAPYNPIPEPATLALAAAGLLLAVGSRRFQRKA